jgi:hypothetical protein
MRKLLMTAAAVTMAGGMVGVAIAQTPTPPLPPLNSPVSQILGGKAAGFQFGSNSSTPSPGADPGTVQAYLRMRLWFDMAVSSDSGSNGTAAMVGKENHYGFAEFARIYPSFDGQTLYGLKYGAYLEVRQNSSGATFGPGTAGGNTGSSSTAGNTLFWRRETGYIGGNFGQVRFGQTDAPMGLFMVGTGENYDTGFWNGDYPGVFNNAETAVTWAFSENGGSYGREKIVYLSPQIAGFDFGASFQPSGATSGEPGCSNQALSGCPLLTSLGTGTFAANLGQVRRTYNDVEGMVRWQGNLGPVGLIVEGGAHTASVVSNSGLTGTATDGSPQYRFKSPTALDLGAQVAIGGLAVGAHYTGGNTNPDGTNTFVPIGGGMRGSAAFAAFASYAFGSAIVGVGYYQLDSGGADTHSFAAVPGVGRFGGRHEIGLNVGGGYNYAPGATIYAEAIYGQRHQGNYNFLDNVRGLAHNNTHAGGLMLTNYFVW